MNKREVWNAFFQRDPARGLEVGTYETKNLPAQWKLAAPNQMFLIKPSGESASLVPKCSIKYAVRNCFTSYERGVEVELHVLGRSDEVSLIVTRLALFACDVAAVRICLSCCADGVVAKVQILDRNGTKLIIQNLLRALLPWDVDSEESDFLRVTWNRWIHSGCCPAGRN